MNDYYFKNETFVVENYNQKKTFANFLPGVAGKMGIPLWAFYVNRGQGIAGYGLQDKNHPIMPFTPANKAYESAPLTGFRTFIKVNGEVYEPFKVDGTHPHKMEILPASFRLSETNETLGLTIEVTYFGLSNMPLAGLVRHVTIKNISSEPMTIEVLDGIAEILPAGIQNEAFKSVSNLLASWIDVEHLDQDFAFYTLRSTTNDSSEVGGVDAGNFYVGLVDNERVKPLVDTALVFGQNTTKTQPTQFMVTSLEALKNANQVTTNKIPCGFIPASKTLKADETLTISAVSGHVTSIEVLEKSLDALSNPHFVAEQLSESTQVIETLLNDVSTDTALPLFDHYVKQNYLDNSLRGGYPEKIGNSIYHLYSRRHGDLERDYNFFSLAPEYYSQGGGNFRDVCQNRRMDSFIHREVEAFNVHHFASLIQLDGYNPLTVNGIVFELNKTIDQEALMKKLFKNHTEKILAFLKKPYTPGNIVNFIEQEHIDAKVSVKEYLDTIIEHSTPSINAAFGEGYWVDHFTYLIDLVENYESIYPDKMDALLYNDENYAYFDSPVTVKPQSEKIVLNNKACVRQYGSLRHFDKEKLKRLNMNPHVANWSKINDEIYTSNLFTKLLVLTLNKHSLLDPDGIGIEMEAEKPGWNDAMNGLPGLLGSGVSESIELWRIVTFMLKHVRHETLSVPKEISTLFNHLTNAPSYEARLTARHTYRDAIRFGLEGAVEVLDGKAIEDYLAQLKNHLEAKTIALYEEHGNIVPTFLYYEVTEFETLTEDGKVRTSNKGYDLVKPKTFKRHALPRFLEAPARLLKTDFPTDKLHAMYEAIKQTEIYDDKLNIYKTSECLNSQDIEIGRIRAFTKGWLERESNFLHMTYKYLLGLLKAGLYDDYYEALETNLVCFMDPAVYGRNPLENSSFIAPSNNPDPALHGQGFFARLTGSTVETLNMWMVMMTGGQPFLTKNGELVFNPKPKLHNKFFKDDHTVSFTFLKNTQITYINESNQHTYDRADIHKIELTKNGQTEAVHAPIVTGEQAEAIRDGLYETIKIYLNKVGGEV